MKRIIINKKRLTEVLLSCLLMVVAQTAQAQDAPQPGNIEIGFEDYKEIFIDTIDFKLNIKVDGVEDTDGKVECHYTVDGSEPTKTSVKTINGHVFKSVFPFTLKIAYVKPDGNLSEVITQKCDVTYSTSENYRNYRHNIQSHSKKGLTIFVRTANMAAPNIYTWLDVEKEDGTKETKKFDGDWNGSSIGTETVNKQETDWMYNTYDTKEINMKLTWGHDDKESQETGDFCGITSDTYFYYFGAGLINAADTYYGKDDKVAFFTPQISNRGNFPAFGADDTSFRDASDAWTNVYCYAYTNNAGEEPLGVWPGVKCELVGYVYMFTHLYNDDTATRRTVRKNIWKIDLNDKTLNGNVHLIFNNGESHGDGEGDKYENGWQSCAFNYTNGGLYTFDMKDDKIGIIQPGKFGESFGETSYNVHIPGDLTYLLSPDWEGDNTTAKITDDWSSLQGKDERVTVNAPTGVAKQTVEGLDKGNNYMVQAIVRAAKDSKIKLKVNGNEATITANGMGSDVESEVNHFGRVDKLHTGEYGGWQKIECSVDIDGTPGSTDNIGTGTITIELSATEGSGFQFSDVTLLENPNTKGMFWTTAPTDEENTFIDFSDRETYNKYSFFDRGGNLNAIVKASPKTVIGMEKDEYEAADHRHPVNVVYIPEAETTAMCKHLYLTDTDGKARWTNSHAFGSDIPFYAYAVTYDRQFADGEYSTLCLPYSLTAAELQTLFGTAVHYDFKGIDDNGETIRFTANKGATTANQPFMLKPGTGKYLTETIEKADGLSVSSGQPEAGTFSGIYKFTPLKSFGTNTLYYIFDAEKGGTYKKVWDDAEGGDIKPFRAYVTAARSNASKQYMMIASDDDNETTGITEISNAGNADSPVYAVDGRRIGAQKDLRGSLKRGVYIINGKKNVIK